MYQIWSLYRQPLLRYRIMVPKFLKIGNVTRVLSPVDLILQVFKRTPRHQSAHQIWILYLQPFHRYRGAPKCKSWSRDLGPVDNWRNFPTIWIGRHVVNPNTKFEVCIFSRSIDIEWSQNLKVSHVPGSCPHAVDLIFQIVIEASSSSIRTPNLKFVFSAAP